MRYSTLTRQTNSKKSPDFLLTEHLAVANALYHENRNEEAHELLTRRIRDARGDERLASAIMLARTEAAMKRFCAGLMVLEDHASLVEACGDEQLRAWFYGVRGALRKDISFIEDHVGNIDRALIDFAASSYHSEVAGDLDVAGCTQNNMGEISAGLGRFDEARDHFKEARRLLNGYPVKLAEVDYSEAEMCLKEGNTLEAVRLASSAVAVFAEHEEKRLLLEARPTLLKALNDYEESQSAQMMP